MTLNGAWGYNAADQNWKSPQTVVQMLARVVSKGGNFLLNFGPTAEGELPAEGVKVVQQVGAWLRVNGEAIYGAGPSDLKGTESPPKAPPEDTAKKGASNAKGKKSRPARKPEPKIDWLATSRPADTATGRPAKIYLIIFKWPAGRLEVKGMTNQISQAYLLGDAKHAPLKFTQQAGTFSVALPANAPDPIATVVCLECAVGN
jgi:alpha-L-fucosidase